MQDDEILTAKEIAKIMKVSLKTVREWVASGDLQVIEIGKREYRISRQALNDFIQKRQRRNQ